MTNDSFRKSILSEIESVFTTTEILRFSLFIIFCLVSSPNHIAIDTNFSLYIVMHFVEHIEAHTVERIAERIAERFAFVVVVVCQWRLLRDQDQLKLLQDWVRLVSYVRKENIRPTKSTIEALQKKNEIKILKQSQN